MAEQAQETRLVQISYDPDRKKVGKYVELPVAEARDKVAGGRARYPSEEEASEYHAKQAAKTGTADKAETETAEKSTPQGAPEDPQPANATETARSRSRSGPTR